MVEPPYNFDPWRNIVEVGWSSETVLLAVRCNVLSDVSPFPSFFLSHFPFPGSYDLFTPGGLAIPDGFRPVPPVSVPDDFPDALFDADMVAHLYAWTDDLEVRPEGGSYQRATESAYFNISKILADYPNDDELVIFQIDMPSPPPQRVEYRNNYIVGVAFLVPAFTGGTLVDLREVIFTDDPDVPSRGWFDLVGFPDLVVGHYPIMIHGGAGEASGFHGANYGTKGYDGKPVSLTHQLIETWSGPSFNWRFTLGLFQQEGDVYTLIDTSTIFKTDNGLINNPNPVTRIEFAVTRSAIIKPRQNTTIG